MAYYATLKTALKRNRPKEDATTQELERLMILQRLDQAGFGFSVESMDDVYTDLIRKYPISWVKALLKEHNEAGNKNTKMKRTDHTTILLKLAENKRRKEVK